MYYQWGRIGLTLIVTFLTALLLHQNSGRSDWGLFQMTVINSVVFAVFILVTYLVLLNAKERSQIWGKLKV